MKSIVWLGFGKSSVIVDDRSAGWGYVNASDPVGIVGEYLGK